MRVAGQARPSPGSGWSRRIRARRGPRRCSGRSTRAVPRGARARQPLRHLRGLGLVAEPAHAQPQHPGGVDPGRAAPVAQLPARAAVGLEARLRRRDRWRRVGRASSASGRAGAPRPGGGRSPPAGRGGRGGRAPPRCETFGRAPPGCTSSRKRPLRSSQSRSTSAGVIEGSPAAIRARPQSTLVITSQSTGQPRSRILRASQPQVAVARDQQREAVAAVLEPAPDRVELRRGVEPGLVRLHQPQQPVALEVAVRPQPLVMGGDPRLGGGVADRDPPGPGEQRRLDRRRSSRRGAR